ncbi:LAGLIDADG family homing endonuclease [Gordonia sp. (in: high G+C Gram-positive bacteria)]|uniref:LAGLIDADG family homing endonuclease n=1 Tax=Gordonia sp. (in: high G+C Gram-positive bacteria) TaxID=84139 RepID=UPI00333F397D
MTLLAGLGREEKIELRRQLAERAARAGIALPNEATPGALAARCDLGLTVERAHTRAMDDVLTPMLGTPNARTMIFTPPQIGKALALDTPILTNRGWSTIAKLRVGDTVYDRHGAPCRVTWKSPVWEDRECFTVRTGDGESIVASAEHEWVARLDRRWGEKKHDTRTLARPRSKNAQITAGAVVDLPERDLPVHPYVLGYWLGDGQTGAAKITTADQEVVDRICSLGYSCRPASGPYSWTLVPENWQRDHGSKASPVKRALNDLALGAGSSKFIPDCYLFGSPRQRRELLQGLIDSDGYVQPNGHVEFCATNRDLAEGVRFLVNSLGAKATINEGRATIGGRDCGVKYRVQFMLREAATIPRKAERCRDSSVAATRYVWAEEADTVPTQCIEVDSPDHTYLAGQTLLPTCNSTRGSRWFPFWWHTNRPTDAIVLASFAAALAQTHGSAVREMVRMYGADYGLRLSATQSTKAAWELTTGGSFKSVGVRGGLSGHPMDLGIIDDPFAGRAEADSPTMREAVWNWYSGVWSARRSPTAREVIIMTRWHQDDLAGRLLDRDGRIEEGGEWRVLHLPALALAPDPKKGVYDDPLGREVGEPLSHPKIADGDTGGLLAHWARQKKRSTPRDWGSMYQGTPWSAEDALLDDQVIRDATKDRPDSMRRIVIGVDPAGGGRDTVGIVAVGLDAVGHAWFLDDRSAKMSAADWPAAVCVAAHEHEANEIVVEKNFGGDMGKQLVAQAWEIAARDGVVSGLCPLVSEVTARQSKVLRAEPIAQAIRTERVWFARGADLSQLTTEWTMWEPGSTWSPGALDAGVHAVTKVLPRVPGGSTVSNPSGRSRQTGGRSSFRRRT